MSYQQFTLLALCEYTWRLGGDKRRTAHRTPMFIKDEGIKEVLQVSHMKQ